MCFNFLIGVLTKYNSISKVQLNKIVFNKSYLANSNVLILVL